jgi:hypothetical protein
MTGAGIEPAACGLKELADGVPSSVGQELTVWRSWDLGECVFRVGLPSSGGFCLAGRMRGRMRFGPSSVLPEGPLRS